MGTTSLLSWMLSAGDRRTLQERVEAFAQGWTPDRLAEESRQLPPPGSPLRLPLLLELARHDLRRHWSQAMPVVAEDYLHAYPELAASDRGLLEMLCAEYEARAAAGQSCGWEHLGQRFPHLNALLRQRLEPTVAGHGGNAEANTLAPEESPSPAVSSQGQALPEQFGPYRIVRRLGRGGMGTVYLAFDTRLERQVALKVPLLDASNPAVLERFYREARLAARLHHPNLCPVHEVGQYSGIHFLTMPYVEGQPLSDWAQPGQFVPERLAVTLVRQAALAVHEAHTQGVIHRDLKPSNIMIDRRGEPVIMDFGLARRTDPGEARLTHSQAILGTPVYMSPEQASGSKGTVGPASDLYTLGVILYELLSGRVPFDGSVTDVLCKIVMEQPPRPSSFRPGLDRALEDICLKAMAKEPRDRFRDMAEFASILGDWLHGTVPVTLVPDHEATTTPARRITVGDRTPRRSGGGLKWLLGCSVVLVVLCGGGGLTLWRVGTSLPGWLEGIVPDSSFSPRGDWANVDRAWDGPAPNASAEELLPERVEPDFGHPWQRTKLATGASLSEYGLPANGRRATYKSGSDIGLGPNWGGQAEVYVWRLPAAEKPRVFKAIIDHARKSDRLHMQWGQRDTSSLTVKAGGRRTTAWFKDDWLYVVQGSDTVDTEVLLLALLESMIDGEFDR